MTSVVEVADLERLHQARVPRMFYDYAASGSWSETTLRDNRSAFERLRFNQRVAVDLSSRSVECELLGQPASLPIALAPIGMLGMQHCDGEIHAARAAAAQNVPFILSTMSICSIEDVAAASPAPFWFQLYVMRDHDFVKRLMDRAKAAGCRVLVLTLDLQLLGQRHADVRNGLSAPPKLTLKNILNMTLHPRWALGMLGTSRRGFGNIVGHVQGIDDMSSLANWTARQFDPALSWQDVEWIRDYWDGPLIIKGVLDPSDAAKAAEMGASAVVISNHGGRQLDGAPASLLALPPAAEAIRALPGRASRCEVWMDGGIRSGQDLLKALALGADAALIGRAYVAGLGAMGQQGVEHAVSFIRRELELSMAFCGVTDVRQVDSGIFWPPPTGHVPGQLSDSNESNLPLAFARADSATGSKMGNP
ncbi:MAG: alpha-hydroxy acid oxidase [Pseudomonadota bacterium]